MKKMTLIFFAAFLMSFPLSAQDNDYEQMAVAMQIHNMETLMDLGLSRDEVEELTALRYELQEKQRASDLEANVIRAQIARLLNMPDAEQKEVYRLLEEHSRLRLEREKNQVEYYFAFRAKFGEREWQELVRRVRSQIRERQQQNLDGRTGKETRSSDTSGSGGSGQGGGRPSSGGGSGK